MCKLTYMTNKSFQICKQIIQQLHFFARPKSQLYVLLRNATNRIVNSSSKSHNIHETVNKLKRLSGIFVMNAKS